MAYTYILPKVLRIHYVKLCRTNGNIKVQNLKDMTKFRPAKTYPEEIFSETSIFKFAVLLKLRIYVFFNIILLKNKLRIYVFFISFY